MAEERKTLSERVGEFIKEHPWMTFFTVTSLIEAPAAIIKAIKWDGKETHVTNYYGSSESTVSSDSTNESE